MNYVCHVICPRFKLSSHTTVAICGLKPPTSLTKLRFFLGISNVLDDLYPAFRKSRPRWTKYWKKPQPKTFTPISSEKLHAMITPKNTRISHPVLALTYSAGHMKLETDACNVQVGCVILQKHPNDTTNPTGYWSRSLTDTDIRYNTTQLRRLGIFEPNFSSGHTSQINVSQFELITVHLRGFWTLPTQQDNSQTGASTYQNLSFTSFIMLE